MRLKKIFSTILLVLTLLASAPLTAYAAPFVTSQGGTATSTAQPNNVLIGKPDGSGWTQAPTSSLGFIGGTGIQDYVARWIGPKTLSTGIFRDNGVAAGTVILDNNYTFTNRADGSQNPFQILNNTNNKLVNVLSNGYFGIGNNVIPETILNISDSNPELRIAHNGADGTQRITFYDDGSEESGIYSDAGDGEFTLRTNGLIGLNTGGSRKVTLLQDGKFGIGTTSPTDLLSVAGSMNLTGAFKANSNPGTLGQVLRSTVTGTQWVSTSSLGITTPPGGSDTNVQFNNGGIFGGENSFVFSSSTNNLSIFADYGSELAPALVSPNYDTLPTGWAYATGPNRITHNANGQTTITPATMSITKGNTYLMSVTIANVTATSSIAFGVGGVEYPLTITSAGTYSGYITAQSTGKATVRAGLSTGRFDVTTLSVKQVTVSQAQFFADGDIYGNSSFTRQAGGIVPYTLTSTIIGSGNDVNPGGRPALLTANLAGNSTVTGWDYGQSNFPGYSITFQVINNSPGALLTFKNQDTGSLAADRIQTWGGDLVMAYKDVVEFTYQPGQISRWSASKVSSGASQFNGDFGTFLSTVVVNAPTMLIGEGNSTINLDESIGISRIGDTQSVTNSNLLEIDDDNSYVTTQSRGINRVISLNSGVNVDWASMTTGSYATDFRVLSLPLKLTDEDGSGTTAPDPSAILDLSSTGSFEGFKRAFLQTRATTAERDTIPSPANGLSLYNTDDRDFQAYDGDVSQWKTLLSTYGKGYFMNMDNGTNQTILGLNSLSLGYGMYLSGTNQNIFAIADSNDGLVYDFTGNGAGTLSIKFGDISGTSNEQQFILDQASASFNFKNGHIFTEGAAPSVSSCGTSPVFVEGNDNAGRIKVGSVVATSCTLTFNASWGTKAPICDANIEGGLTIGVAASSTPTTVVFTGASALTGNVITYQCIGVK